MKRTLLALLAGVVAVTTSVVAPAPASAAVDVYLTPGYHNVGGRQWRTSCEAYSQTQRCRTEIWATQISKQAGRWVQSNGWVFNNLTYAPSPRSVWATNPLGGYGKVGGTVSWTDASGRGWRTECDNASTGRNGCRTYAQATVVSAASGRFVQSTQWVLNNMVRFSTSTTPAWKPPVQVPTPQPGDPAPPAAPTPLPKPPTPPGMPYDAQVGVDSQEVFSKSVTDYANLVRAEFDGTDGISTPPVSDRFSLVKAEALECAQSNLSTPGSLSHELPGCAGVYPENLAGAHYGETASSIVSRWKQSPGHFVGMVGRSISGFGSAYACTDDKAWCVAVQKRVRTVS